MRPFHLHARHIHLLSALLLGLVVAGCAVSTDTARLDEVARAGIAYADKIPPLLDRAFELTVGVDSGALVEARRHLAEDERRQVLDDFDAAMAERLTEYVAAKRHNAWLRSYFVALRALLKPDGPKGVGHAAERLTVTLGKLSPVLKKARVGDVSVSGLVEPAASIAVASFRSEVLRRELEARGQAIERELALQEALVTALARQIRADREVLSARFRNDEVLGPYVSAARLPKTWPARRLRSLRDTADVEAARAAEQAIRSLRNAYVEALEGRLDAARAVELAATVEGFVELVSRLAAGAGRAVR
ncbi:MAG: hypothetical protein OXK20_04505 [Deltaproteobacteria bacterium]|nr:hypothetical protein [Deltaproteobacteria bacterium]